MPLANAAAVAEAAVPFDAVHILFTLSVLVVTVSMVSMCMCCGNKNKGNDEDDCAYGVVNPAAVTNTSGDSAANRSINFRPISSVAQSHDRHSQPAGTRAKSVTNNRASAPMPTGRALPQLPADLYTAIDKKRKTDNIQFVDETVNPMYECIDVETDSFVDPLYSKVGEVRTAPNGTRDRRYDYPIFAGRQNGVNRPSQDEVLYQSASQIYGAGSEDPYSSITSERGRTTTAAEADGDSSSAYDPGYAKVVPNSKPKTIEEKKKEKIEKTERELDLLYSKIRRNNGENEEEDNLPGPSRVEASIPLPPIEPLPEPTSFDGQSAVSSREPSYRYITMRENADVVRERLRQQGQLERPIREHYYSTIGNDYETINTPGPNNNSTRNFSLPPQVQANIVRTPIVPPTSSLSLSLASQAEAPPPPTSPIPDRTRPLSLNEGSLLDSALSPLSPSIPQPPDLRCSPVPPPPGKEETNSADAYATVTKNRSRERIQTTFAVMPEVMHTSLHNSQDFHPHTTGMSTYIRNGPVAEINEFMNRPTLPYRSLDTLIGKRTVEEKETIVEKRSSVACGIPLANVENTHEIMSKSFGASFPFSPESERRIHEVTIMRVPPSSEGSGPSASEIVSGRTYHGTAVNFSSENDIHVKKNTNGIDGNASNSLVSPTDMNKNCVNNELSVVGTSSTTKDVSLSKKKKPWKEETQDEKIRRLGTIYTANDYVSSVDMGTDRPWPLSSRSRDDMSARQTTFDS